MNHRYLPSLNYFWKIGSYKSSLLFLLNPIQVNRQVFLAADKSEKYCCTIHTHF